MKFRTDINGLRAYAVLAVIIFHFNKQWLSGGFAGVDVFFVISGYLMTSIIFRGLEGNTFSLWKFYAARIKRIVPALLVLIIVLMIFGYLFLGPIPYASLSKHSGGSLLFISNIMYWKESGYFDAAALEKFLLHTWSLSVEWQFYIIYPVVLWVLSKLFKLDTIKNIIAFGTVLAFIFSIYASQRWSVASYFLLPTRIWEMLLGGIAFLYPFEFKKQSDKHILELSGLGLIVVSFFVITENMIWPGYAALIPTLGAFVLIQANNDKSIFTNNIICQKIGLWSYSLYLWHWSLLATYNYFGYKIKIWPFLFVTLACGIASYYLIEKRKWNVWLVIGVTIITLVGAFGVYKTNGASYRMGEDFDLTKEEWSKKHYAPNSFNNPSGNLLILNTDIKNAKYIFSGDSYSLQYLKFIEDEKIPAISIGQYVCLILPNILTDNNTSCKATYDKLIEILSINHTADVIINQNWLAYGNRIFDYQNQAITEDYTEAIVKSLKGLFADGGQKRNYYIIGRYQYPIVNSRDCAAQEHLPLHWLLKGCPSNQSRNYYQFNEALSLLASEYNNVYYIDPNPAMCTENSCTVIINKQPLHFDNDHLSIYGANIVGNYIFDVINKSKNSD